MQTMNIRHLMKLNVLVLGLGWAGMIHGCGGSVEPDAPAAGVDPPDPLGQSALPIKKTSLPKPQTAVGPNAPSLRELDKCSDAAVAICKQYRIELLGDTTNNIELRKQYKAEFGTACYVSAANSFNCYFKTPQRACQEVLRVPKIFGAADYENHPKTCQQIPGTENWSLQTGSDPANVTRMYYEDPPLQHPLMWVDGVPTLEVNGPYRNLPEPSTVKVGGRFDCYIIDGVNQKERILQMNRKKNGGKIRSDLAGYMYPCTNGSSMMCPEPEFLNEPPPRPKYDPNAAQVDHVASRKDPRGCEWGTNSNKNAAVISAQLNIYFSNRARGSRGSNQRDSAVHAVTRS